MGVHLHLTATSDDELYPSMPENRDFFVDPRIYIKLKRGNNLVDGRKLNRIELDSIFCGCKELRIDGCIFSSHAHTGDTVTGISRSPYLLHYACNDNVHRVQDKQYAALPAAEFLPRHSRNKS